MDITAVTTLIGSIKTATEIVQFFRDSDLKFEEANAKFKLSELISLLADAKNSCADLEQNLLEKNHESKSWKSSSL